MRLRVHYLLLFALLAALLIKERGASGAETPRLRACLQKHLTTSSRAAGQLPFAFDYGERRSDDFLRELPRSITSQHTAQGEERIVEWSEPAGGAGLIVT